MRDRLRALFKNDDLTDTQKFEALKKFISETKERLTKDVLLGKGPGSSVNDITSL